MVLRVRYLDARPFTVETTLSRASRPAPTGTSTARSASTCAWATRVLGCVEDVVARVERRALVVVRDVRAPVVAGLRRVVCLVVVVGRCVPGVLVAIGVCLSTN